MGIDMTVTWAVIIFFAVFMYVLLDGFDLGIGLLFPFTPDKRDRDTMMHTVAPVWDGNETWLVLGGTGLLAAFPVAYAIILSGLYLPLVFMLIGLVFRGVAFEFRFKAREGERHLWDQAFIGGSVVAAFFQGVALGAFLDGITVSGRSFAGGALDWLAPFPLLAGMGVMVAYTLLGATWLVMKTEGELHARMVQVARPFALMLLAAIAIVSIWTPLRDPAVATRWFSFPNIVLLAPVPVLVLVFIALLLWALRGKDQRLPHRLPFVAALALVFLGYCGMAISIWPHIVPPAISIWEAASPPSSQGFALVGTLVILPVVLVYTGWSYWVFRGKVKADAGYH
ncbi:cytochrome d ubiquinol oxidase subunit II [Massilia yuzhufengensis]|uniref:Cytochrome bd-I ubiquinol oxidase subunit 2 apoprotein n=1 Tax=Massilia yuzhufengensis TaxID=1164594 RepID=A0A1I1QKV8_9BURK|nr:cytochrome d ubiquinol oxidase subunit II [Massilia yuzhufengensis]SFD22689.1 cytochrome bd-I ubiquinol oxidase subunit 2 apoprotein [Massilia yuzhufengensis]